MTAPRSRALAISMGEPGGIGTEILFKAYHQLTDSHVRFFVVDDPQRLTRLAQKLVKGTKVVPIVSPLEASEAFVHGLPVLALKGVAASCLSEVTHGKACAATAPAVLGSIEDGVRAVLQGDASGLVTLPIQKATLQEAGFAFPGHTEFLGELTAQHPLLDSRTRGPVMMLAADHFRTVPVTVHIPIAAVPAALSTDLIVERSLVTAEALRHDFSIARPRLAITGLNPHAGEDGRMGREDQEIIVPAVTALQSLGIDAAGPLPADTLFHAEARNQYDAALAMYHDQALIPIKTVAFHDAVNVTLGLPIIRTSPDHGTGLDIAGQGLARPDSLIAAIRMAAKMAEAREHARA